MRNKCTTVQTIAHTQQLHNCTNSATAQLYKLNNCTTVRIDKLDSNYIYGGQGVRVTLKSGDTVDGDILVGVDGIWSNIRAQLWDQVRPAPARTGSFYFSRYRS